MFELPLSSLLCRLQSRLTLAAPPVSFCSLYIKKVKKEILNLLAGGGEP